MSTRKLENPFLVSCLKDELTIKISKDLRDSDWASYFGQIQHSIRTKQWKGRVVNTLTINLEGVQWADPLPLLHLMLSMNEFARNGGDTKVEIPIPAAKSSRFLKFLAQEGFLKLMFDISGLVVGENGVLRPEIIDSYCSLTADLAYVNSTIIPAELIQCVSLERIDQWVEEKIEKAGGIVESKVPRWAFEELMYRLKMFLIETLHNVFLHAYEEGQTKSAALYIRFREGLMGVNPEQQTNLEGSLRNESIHCPHLTIEHLKEREGCIESFVADAGVGLTKTLSGALRTISGEPPRRPFSFACERIFLDGLRRADREARTSTSGLNLLARLLDQDFIRGMDADEWVGTVLPLNRAGTNISIPAFGEQCCDSIVKGLSWMVRLSWQSPTDLENLGWCQFDKDVRDHPIFKETGLSREKGVAETRSWLVDDQRFLDLGVETEHDHISTIPPGQDSYLLLVRPGFAKNDILNHVEDIAKKIPSNRQVNLLIADIPAHEAITYASALNNTRIRALTPYMLWPSRFSNITLLSQSMSAYVLDYDPETNGYRHNKTKSSQFLEGGLEAVFDPSSNIYQLFYWLKFHDTKIFWNYIRKILDSAFVNGRIGWTGNIAKTEMTGYLDFAQTLSDLFCKKLYWVALLRISGLSSAAKYRLLPIDSLVKSLATLYNAKVLPVLKGQERNMYIGSVKVSGLTEEEAISRSEDSFEHLALHFFSHPDSQDSKTAASLFFWARNDWIQKWFPEKSGYKRVGQSSTIAQGGSKYFVMPRYDATGRSLYVRSPRNSYEDWQNRNPVLVKMGHWEYQSHHDLLTVNLWSALKYSFATYGSLARFLMSEFFGVLGIKRAEDLTQEGKRWLDKVRLGNPSTLPAVCAIVYPSHSTTHFVIENLFRAILPEVRKRVVAVHPVRRINSGSPALVSPLALDVVSGLISRGPSRNILFFDDALVTGRTNTEIEALLKERGASDVYRLCILERRRLPGRHLDPKKEVLYWRLDVPALGDGNSCIVCKALSAAADFSHSLVSYAAKERIKSWISDWQVGSPIIDWWDKGLTPVKATLKNPQKKFAIKPSSPGIYEQIGGSGEKISLYNSAGLSLFASELHAMTSHDAYALELTAEETSLSDMAKIELISSQLILFHGEFSSKTQSELLKAVLLMARGIEDTNKFTSLTALVCMIQDATILSKIMVDLCKEETFSGHILNEDVLLVMTYAMHKDPLLFHKIRGKNNTTRAHRLLRPDIDIGIVYDTLHSEIFDEEGDIHARPLSRFGRDASYEIAGKSIDSKIWDADSNISMLKHLINEIDPGRIRKENERDTPFELKQAVANELEANLRLLSELRIKSDRTSSEISTCKESVERLISSLKQLHGRLFYNLGISDINEYRGYPFEENKLIYLLSDVASDEWKASFRKKCIEPKWEDKPNLCLSRSGDAFPSRGRKDVWVVWDYKIETIVRDLMTNVLYATHETADPWSANEGTAHMWVAVRYSESYLTVILANAYESNFDHVDHEARKKGKWLALEELGGSVLYKEAVKDSVKILETIIEIPYAGNIRHYKLGTAELKRND